MVGGRETGNETYIRGLVEGFSQLEGDFEVSVYHVGDPWRPADHRLDFRRLTTASPWVRLTAELPRRAANQRADILHMTYVSPLWSPCPIVLTVHDISYATHPDWFSARDRVVLSATVPWSIPRPPRG